MPNRGTQGKNNRKMSKNNDELRWAKMDMKEHQKFLECESKDWRARTDMTEREKERVTFGIVVG